MSKYMTRNEIIDILKTLPVDAIIDTQALSWFLENHNPDVPHVQDEHPAMEAVAPLIRKPVVSTQLSNCLWKVQRLVVAGRPISAIRALREVAGLNIRDAKRVVEMVQAPLKVNLETA